MNSRKYVIVESLVVLAGQAVCVAAMVGIFALVGHFDWSVLWGALIGFVLTVANFFVMAVGTSLAADKAQAQNVTGGKNLLRGSMGLRYVVLFVVMFAFAKSGIADAIALVVPLIFVRFTITLAEFFRKK